MGSTVGAAGDIFDHVTGLLERYPFVSKSCLFYDERAMGGRNIQGPIWNPPEEKIWKQPVHFYHAGTNPQNPQKWLEKRRRHIDCLLSTGAVLQLPNPFSSGRRHADAPRLSPPQQSSVQLVWVMKSKLNCFFKKKSKLNWWMIAPDCNAANSGFSHWFRWWGQFSLFVSASTAVPCHPNRHAHFRRDRNGWALAPVTHRKTRN